jgi:antitoxin (DNA-binding transcriptional repressor) of toxin-antitoxin stability system
MQTITVADLRDQLSQIIDQTTFTHQRFLVTKFNKPRALIIPIPNHQKTTHKQPDFKTLPGFGLWKNRSDIKNSVSWSQSVRHQQSLRHSSSS